MKKSIHLLQFVLLFVFSLLLTVNTMAQVIFQDDFESYIVDSIITLQSSEWNSRNGVNCNTVVTNDIAYSGTKSLKLWDGLPNAALIDRSEIILDLKNKTTGRYKLSFKVYIPSVDNRNSFKISWFIAHTMSSAYDVSDWAFEIAWLSDIPYIYINGENHPFPFEFDKWVEVVHVLDLDMDRQDIFYDGKWVFTHLFSTSAFSSTTGPNRLAGIGFSAYSDKKYNSKVLAYIDDVEFKHFNDPKNDAGIMEVDVPVYCNIDSAEIFVKMKNWGFNNITKATIGWSIDGVLQTPFEFTGNIPFSAEEGFSIGKHRINGTLPIEIKVWPATVNGVADTINFNDTLKIVVGNTGLIGQYTVDSLLPSSSTNFQSIAELSQALDLSGICGPTTIIISENTYNEKLNLVGISGLSNINTLLIDGQDSSKTAIASEEGSPLLLSNVRHVTIKNLGFLLKNSDDIVMDIFQSDSNKIESCVSRAEFSNSLYNPNIRIGGLLRDGYLPSMATANYNTIKHTKVIGGNVGISINGNDFYKSTGNQILYNIIDSTYRGGIDIANNDYIKLEGNIIDAYEKGSFTSIGISITKALTAEIIGNNIIANYIGLYWNNYSEYNFANTRSSLINNMIYSEFNTALSFLQVDSIDIFHNSIYSVINNLPAASFTTETSRDIYSYDIRNNIFYSDNSAAFHIASEGALIKFDYNIFHFKGQSLMTVGARTFRDLSEQQIYNANWNSNSYVGDPSFLSFRDLHLSDSLANDVGDNTVGVAVDIDLELRPAAGSIVVDIGADEFSPLSCAPPLKINMEASGTMVKLKYKMPVNISEVQFELISCGSNRSSAILYTTQTDSLDISNLNPLSCYMIYARTICTAADTSIWVGPLYIKTKPQSPVGVNCINGNVETIFSEHFNDPIANGWTGDIGRGYDNSKWNVANGSSYDSNTGPSKSHSGTNNIYAHISEPNGEVSMLSPMIDLTQVKDSAELSFWFHAYGRPLGIFEVSIATSKSGLFQKVMEWSKGHGTLQESANETYYQVGVRLDDFVGERIYIQFHVKKDIVESSEFAIDLMEVKACVSCNTPSSLSILNKNIEAIDIDWTENGSATKWEIAIDSLENIDQSKRIVATSKPFTINNLTSAVNYQLYIRSICGSGDTSGWYGPISYVGILSIPYFEDFESFPPKSSMDNWSNGWTQYRNAEANGLKWSMQVGPIEGISIGPEVDHTLGTDKGVYAYCYDGYLNEWVELITPEMYVDSNLYSIELSYWCHFHGESLNKMEVLISSDGGSYRVVDQIAGGQQTSSNDSWRSRVIALNGYQGKVIRLKFRAYSGDYAVIAIDDISIIPLAPYYPIGEINKTNTNGEATSLGEELWTSGVVVGVNLHPNAGLSYTLIDMKSKVQEGIQIYSDWGADTYRLKEGDSIMVRGIIEQQNGLTSLRMNSIKGTIGNRPLPAPIVVDKLDESTESKLLKMEELILLDPSLEGTYNMRALSGEDTVVIKIHKNTDVSAYFNSTSRALEIGDTICSMLGVGGQYDTSLVPPYLGGYFITPMFIRDVYVCGENTGIEKNQEGIHELLYYPNPTNGSFTISSSVLETDNVIIVIRDISGRAIVEESINTSGGTFNKEYNLSKQAKGLYFISIIGGDKQINKKLILK